MGTVVLCFVFYVLGIVVGLAWHCRERGRLWESIHLLEADLAEDREQINYYYEHPQKFLDDVNTIRTVTGAPVYGDYGRLVDDPKLFVSPN